MTTTESKAHITDGSEAFEPGEYLTITPPSQWPQFLRNVAAVALGVWMAFWLISASVWVAKNLQVPEELRSEQRE